MGLIPCQINSLDSQREQLTLCDASNSFPPIMMSETQVQKSHIDADDVSLPRPW